MTLEKVARETPSFVAYCDMHCLPFEVGLSLLYDAHGDKKATRKSIDEAVEFLQMLDFEDPP